MINERTLATTARTVVVETSLLLLVVWLFVAMAPRKMLKFAALEAVGPLALLMRSLPAFPCRFQTADVVALSVYAAQLRPSHAVKALVELFAYFAA